MPRALTDNGRVELRLRPEDKATLIRAASIKRLDPTGCILRAVLPQAEADIAEAERLALSERDSLRVLALLENPSAASPCSSTPRTIAPRAGMKATALCACTTPPLARPAPRRRRRRAQARDLGRLPRVSLATRRQKGKKTVQAVDEVFSTR